MMWLRTLAGIYLLILLATSAAVSAEEASADPWQDLRGVLRQVGEVQTYSADFTQQKFTPLLRDPIESQGKVRIVPGFARWDTQPPYDSTMVVAGTELKMYYPQQNSLEVYELGDRLESLASSPVPQVEMLQEYFELESSAWNDDRSKLELTLTPKRDEMKDALVEAKVSFDAERGVLDRLEMTDADDETTVLTFREVQLNPEIDRSSLELEVPEGTQVVHPLEDASR